MSEGSSKKVFPVSWEQFHRDGRALAWRLAASGPLKGLIAITRGGLVPAAIVSRELELRIIETFCVASYDYRTQGDLEILKLIAERFTGGLHVVQKRQARALRVFGTRTAWH